MARDIKFTYEHYCQLPEGDRYELIEGELLLTPSPTVRHQRVAATMQEALRTFVKANDLGSVFYAPLDVVLSDENVVQPDILFISKERDNIIKEENIQGPPDLVVEIISPSTAERDRSLKKALYGKFGVREYWIVDPEIKQLRYGTWASGVEWNFYKHSRQALSPRPNCFPDLKWKWRRCLSKPMDK